MKNSFQDSEVAAPKPFDLTPLKAYLIIYASLGAGIAQTIFSLIQSDFTFIWPPTNSLFFDAIFIPVVFLITPSVFIWCVFMVMNYFSRGISFIFISIVMLFGVLLWGLRFYYVVNGHYFSSCILFIIISVSVFILLLIFKRFFIVFFSYLSIMVFISMLIFISNNYNALYVYSLVYSTEKGDEKNKIKKGKDVPVFIIVYDELSSFILRGEKDYINKSLFPNFNSLASNGTLYINATTGESNTNINLNSIASGVDLFTKKNRGKIPNMFNALSPVYNVKIWGSFPNIIKKDESMLVKVSDYTESIIDVYLYSLLNPKALARFGIDISSRAFDGNDKNVTDESFSSYLHEFLSEITGDKNQVKYFYSHYPHATYKVNPDGSSITLNDVKEVSSKTGAAKNFSPISPRSFHTMSKAVGGETVSNIRRSYINEVRYADNVLGSIVAKMKEKNIYNDSLLIVLSDHGIGFTENAQGREINPDISPIFVENHNMMNGSTLLIVKYPNQKSSKIDPRLVRPYDIGATVFDTLNITPIWDMDGVSLLKQPVLGRKLTFRPKDSRQNFMDTVELYRPAEYTLIYKRKGSKKVFPLINRTVKSLNLLPEISGRLVFIAMEKSLPGESYPEFLLTLSGCTWLKSNETVPKNVYIAVNGRIAMAVTPGQYCCVDDECSKMHLRQKGWTAVIPHGYLSDGANIIKAFSPSDSTETSFIAHDNYLIFDAIDYKNKLGILAVER